MRLRLVRSALFSLALLVGTGPLVGCRKKAADQASVNADSVKQSLAALRKQLDELKTRFMGLREQVEAIPKDLDGFGEARARFYAAEEGRGITDGKVVWLSGRIDAALSSGNSEELQAISKDIAATYDDIRRIDQVYVKLLHQMMAFERMSRQQKAEASAAASNPAPRPKPKRAQSKP